MFNMFTSGLLRGFSDVQNIPLATEALGFLSAVVIVPLKTMTSSITKFLQGSFHVVTSFHTHQTPYI